MASEKYSELTYHFQEFLSDLSSVQKTIIHNKKTFKVYYDDAFAYQLIKLEDQEKQDILDLTSKSRRSDRQKRNQLRINNNSTLIFIISLFERFRGSLLKCSYKNNKNTVKFIKRAFLDYSKQTDIPAQKNMISDLLVIKEDELYDHLHHLHGRQYEVEKTIYGLRNDEIPKEIKKGLLSFQIFREIRNLLTHRGNKVDEKLLSGIKHSLPKELKSNKKKTDELYRNLRISSIMNQIGQEINIPDVALINLIYDLVNVSVFMLFGAFNRFPIKEDFPDILGGFFNDSLVTCYEDNNKKEYLAGFINYNLFKTFNLFNQDLNKFKFKTDLFYINSIAIIKSHIEFNSTLFKKLKFDKKEDIFKILNKKMDFLLAEIQDNTIKRIAKYLIKDDDYRFIKSVEKWLIKNKKDVNDIYGWSTIEMKKNSLLVINHIRYMERIYFEKKIDKAQT